MAKLMFLTSQQMDICVPNHWVQLNLSPRRSVCVCEGDVCELQHLLSKATKYTIINQWGLFTFRNERTQQARWHSGLKWRNPFEESQSHTPVLRKSGCSGNRSSGLCVDVVWDVMSSNSWWSAASEGMILWSSDPLILMESQSEELLNSEFFYIQSVCFSVARQAMTAFLCVDRYNASLTFISIQINFCTCICCDEPITDGIWAVSGGIGLLFHRWFYSPVGECTVKDPEPDVTNGDLSQL